MYVVTVLFKVKSENQDAFSELVRENARASLANEPACLRFDVCRDPAKPNAIFLYEIYEDKSSFTDHLKSAHFISFDRAVADMIISKEVDTYSEVWV